ncbi:DUF2505 domain-containing protein [Modestobacter sp. SSW1-42]|uniref:DUF2505 domain-containing protein n=1 Tax=Modestobacter sp. SSW1-42 TaxID=596372 RepID=UPI00398739A2
MPIDSTVSYPASPDAVVAVLTDEQFLRDRAAALNAQVQEVTVTGQASTVRLSAPTAGIPPVFARFVGSSVTVVERSAWVPDGEGGHRSALDVQSEVFGREVRVTGERRLRPEAGGTQATVTGDVRVDAPIVGKQAENAVRELMTVVLRKEDQLLRARLA